MELLKLTLLFSFYKVFWEDFKHRLVYWFWFPIIAFCSGFLLFQAVGFISFFKYLVFNIGFIAILHLIIWAYALLKLKMPLRSVFGLGDTLFLVSLSFGFVTTSFMVLLIFGLLFSLVSHLIFSRKTPSENVPLAGWLSLFFGVGHVLYWFRVFSFDLNTVIW